MVGELFEAVRLMSKFGRASFRSEECHLNRVRLEAVGNPDESYSTGFQEGQCSRSPNTWPFPFLRDLRGELVCDTTSL